MNAPLPEDEATRLATLRRLAILDTPSEAVFDALATLAARICGTPIALLAFIDAERDWFKARTGFPLTELPRDISLCAYTILGKETFVVPDALADPRFRENPLVTGDPHLRFYAGAPIRLGAGSAIGTLCVADTKPHALTEEQGVALQDLAALATAQLESRLSRPERELLVETTRLNEDLAALASITDRALSTLDLEALMKVLLERLVHVMKADAGAILLDEGGRLVVRAMEGFSGGIAGLPPIPFGEGIGGRVAATGAPVYVADVRTDPRAIGRFLKDQGVVSMLGVPLKTKHQLVGVLHVDWRAPHAESASDIHLLETAAERCATAIVNARLFEALRAKHSQAELLLEREKEARLLAERAERQIVNILERVTDAFVALDTEWRYTYVSRKAAEIFARRPEQLVGRHIWTEFPEGVGQPFYLAYQRAAAEQVPVQMEEFYPPYDRWFENRIYPSADGLSIFFSDITERKRTDALLKSTNEQLRALSARLSNVREEEAVRISREIHDELGQLLTALRMDVSWVRSRLERVAPPGSPETAALLARTDDMVQLTDRTIRSVQRISEELRPAALDQLGLEAAIEAQLADLAGRIGVVTHFAGGLGDRRLGSDVETGVFRIVQELLTNVARHSGAHEVRVALELSGGTLTVRVSDDGRGIRPDDLAAPRSLGLVGMRERALLLGGRVDLRAGEAGGTEALVTVPATGAAA